MMISSPIRRRTLLARRFTLADAMILIAATAAGLACSRVLLLTYGLGSSGTPGVLASYLKNLLHSIEPCLMFWGIGVLICRMRRPRPPLRRLASQPGAVACLAAVLFLAIKLVRVLLVPVFQPYLAGPVPSPTQWDLVSYISVLSSVDSIPAVVWLLMVIFRRWRAEPSWIDRAGRVLGACWIAESFIYAQIHLSDF